MQARDEAQGMKPSVARKLNEKIRALEAELETLRTNKKVSELERKVKVLISCFCSQLIVGQGPRRVQGRCRITAELTVSSEPLPAGAYTACAGLQGIHN